MTDSKLLLKGILVAGFREGAYYMRKEPYKKDFKKKLGYNPWPGTLNIRINSILDLSKIESIEIGSFKENEKIFGSLRCYPCCIVSKKVLITHIVVPKINKHPKDIIELISSVSIKKTLHLKDGDTIKIQVGKKYE